MKPRNASGFTLVELMVSVSVLGLLGAAVSTFYVESITAANTTQQHIRLMGEMRTLASDMLINGARAHELILYASPDAADRVDSTSRLEIETDETTGDLTCPVGNLAVFVYYELPKPSTQARYRVARIIAYALDCTADDPGALTRLTIDLSAAPSTLTVEEILAAHWDAADRRSLGRLVTPLALGDDGGTTPRLFYKRSDQNLAVCGQFLSNAADVDTRDRNTATRTVFFTVTTRS